MKTTFSHSIGVVPHEPGMSGAADRRRLGCWARARGIDLQTAAPEKARVVVVHPLVDHQRWVKWRRARADRRLILNVVDFRYLSEALEPATGLPSRARDAGRSLLYSTGVRRLAPPGFGRRLALALGEADAVVTSSVEHVAFLTKHGLIAHHILDCHEEIPMMAVKARRPDNRLRLLWEGKLATLSFLREVAPALRALASTTAVDLMVCTDPEDFRFANRFGKVTPSRLLESVEGIPGVSIHLLPWTTQVLAGAAQTADAAILPVDRGDSAAWMKAENRLMIMWRLGLPVVMSGTPAYSRAAVAAGAKGVAGDASHWLSLFENLLDSNWRTQEALKGQQYVQRYHSPSTLHRAWDNVFGPL